MMYDRSTSGIAAASDEDIMGDLEKFDWNPVIGRTLALVCLRLAGLDKSSLVERADFWMALGLPRREAAIVLHSTDDSLRVMQSRAAKAKNPEPVQAAT